MKIDERLKENLNAAAQSVADAAPMSEKAMRDRVHQRRVVVGGAWSFAGLAVLAAFLLVGIGRPTVLVEGGVGAGDSCPVTLPNGFTPPDGYPATPVAGGGWHGSADLWTVLPVDGDYQRRKSVWWSQNFPGGAVEEQPPINVTWTRLDSDDDALVSEGGTNAYTVEDGWFMIAGIDPDEPGCWEVAAEYKGTTLSYVYEQR